MIELNVSRVTSWVPGLSELVSHEPFEAGVKTKCLWTVPVSYGFLSEPEFYFSEAKYQVDEGAGSLEVNVWKTGTDLSQPSMLGASLQKFEAAEYLVLENERHMVAVVTRVLHPSGPTLTSLLWSSIQSLANMPEFLNAK
ncbi:hypothetical protein DPMN_106528 [Dreissena polymorpha]|uniref:Uncharacterized protein n=1 Tax=Dreissena polymorpha TaxID=45954 RepID=A0A9D4K546_DREPO|nr:hypothetical protein DPMN_106528 [Dreissena polymorpha]